MRTIKKTTKAPAACKTLTDPTEETKRNLGFGLLIVTASCIVTGFVTYEVTKNRTELSNRALLAIHNAANDVSARTEPADD